MPDMRQHRGPHPADSSLFSMGKVPILQRARYELSWLLDQGYSSKASLALVGDRHALRHRQRVAVARCVCTHEEDKARASRQIMSLAQRTLWIDGFNLLTTIEAALGDGVLLIGRDRVMRDMASMHGNYRRVAETEPALQHIAAVLDDEGPTEVVWWLDRPVSNSGRLATLIRTIGETRSWRVELHRDPDRVLVETDAVVASADSAVLDGCGPWFNLARTVVDAKIADAWVIHLEERP